MVAGTAAPGWEVGWGGGSAAGSAAGWGAAGWAGAAVTAAVMDVSLQRERHHRWFRAAQGEGLMPCRNQPRSCLGLLDGRSP